jgi:hypothetical protein
MGICMSSSPEDGEQKKRSQAIDRKLEEDSRRLRRECKILLLGTHQSARACTREETLTCTQALAKAASRPSSSR